MRDFGQALCARALNRAPQIVGAGIAVSVLLHIIADAAPPDIFARKSLQHGDYSLALLIGDCVKRLASLFNGLDRLDHGMCSNIRINAHCAFATINSVDIGLPLWVEMMRRFALHPAGKTFVEPKIVPPLHRHQIAEPLVRDFMCVGLEDTLFGARAGDFGVVEQHPFKGEDRAPIFHRTEKLALTRASHIVELGQGEGNTEIVVIIIDDLCRSVERILAFCGIALAHDDANLGWSHFFGDPVKFTQPEKQQIGRHFGRSAKGCFC